MNRNLALVMAIAAPLAGCPVAIGPDAMADFTATLSGQAEVPSVSTPTTGDARLFIHPDSNAIDFELVIEQGQNVLGAEGAHLHCATAGENGPVVAFLAGEVPGGFDGRVELEATLTDANIVDDSCGATISELVDAMFDGRVYVNVHSEEHPAGVIRGQLTADDKSLF